MKPSAADGCAAAVWSLAVAVLTWWSCVVKKRARFAISLLLATALALALAVSASKIRIGGRRAVVLMVRHRYCYCRCFRISQVKIKDVRSKLGPVSPLFSY